MKSDKAWKIIIYLSVLGMLLASYLLYNYLAADPSEVCNINDRINCDAVTKGPLAEFLGIPVSLIGLLGYITIFYSAVKKNKKLVLGMTSFGMLFCLRLTILEIFDLKVICPVCVLCQTIMLIVFILSIRLYKYNPKNKISKPKKSKSKTL